ncbi:unnamed protein product [Closterium sp. Naga37s-1]|nr:unnamed protein product [Closterium sp. Naga37s-1]
MHLRLPFTHLISPLSPGPLSAYSLHPPCFALLPLPLFPRPLPYLTSTASPLFPCCSSLNPSSHPLPSHPHLPPVSSTTHPQPPPLTWNSSDRSPEVALIGALLMPAREQQQPSPPFTPQLTHTPLPLPPPPSTLPHSTRALWDQHRNSSSRPPHPTSSHPSSPPFLPSTHSPAPLAVAQEPRQQRFLYHPPHAHPAFPNPPFSTFTPLPYSAARTLRGVNTRRLLAQGPRVQRFLNYPLPAFPPPRSFSPALYAAAPSPQQRGALHRHFSPTTLHTRSPYPPPSPHTRSPPPPSSSPHTRSPYLPPSSHTRYSAPCASHRLQRPLVRSASARDKRPRHTPVKTSRELTFF